MSNSQLIEVFPECRYGHGALVREPGLWAIHQIRKGEGVHATQTFPTGISFAFSLFRCQKCGYLELFDDKDAI